VVKRRVLESSIDTPHERDGGLGLAVGEAERAKRSLVIVSQDQPVLYEHLNRQFAYDRSVVVVVDRRREAAGRSVAQLPWPERRRPPGHDQDVRLHWVVVVSERPDVRVLSAPVTASPGAATVAGLHEQIHATEQEISRLRDHLVELRRQLGLAERAAEHHAVTAPEPSRHAKRAR